MRIALVAAMAIALTLPFTATASVDQWDDGGGGSTTPQAQCAPYPWQVVHMGDVIIPGWVSVFWCVPGNPYYLYSYQY